MIEENRSLIVVGLICLLVIAMVSLVEAYTPPSASSVNLSLTSGYSIPSADSVNLTLGEATSCTISTNTVIFTNLDCSGETFLVESNAVATINSGVTVTSLQIAIESGSSIVSEGTLLAGVS